MRRGDAPPRVSIDLTSPGGYQYRAVPLVLRWLVPLFTAFALLAQPVTAIASAGLQGDTSCCCPKPEDCTCHDHKDAPHDHQKMRRCGNPAAITIAAPLLMAALPPPSPPMVLAPERASAPVVIPISVPDDRSIQPETPPF